MRSALRVRSGSLRVPQGAGEGLCVAFAMLCGSLNAAQAPGGCVRSALRIRSGSLSIPQGAGEGLCVAFAMLCGSLNAAQAPGVCLRVCAAHSGSAPGP